MRKKLMTLLLAIVASIVTAWGQFNIPVMNESDEIIIYQNCSLNTEVRETLPKKFTHASCSIYLSPLNIVSDTSVVAYYTNDKGNREDIYGCLVAATVSFYSEGFGINDYGELYGSSTGYIINMPAYIAYMDYGMNPNSSLFSKNFDHTWIATGSWKTEEQIKSHSMVAGGIKDETTYLNHIKAAVAAANKEDFNTYESELEAACNEGLQGGMLYKYSYDENQKKYISSSFPIALVTNCVARITNDNNDMYMYDIESEDFNVIMKPFAASELFDKEVALGVEMEEDEATGKYSVKSTKIEFESDIVYGEKSNANIAARKEPIHSITLSDLHEMNMTAKVPNVSIGRYNAPIAEKAKIEVSTSNCDSYTYSYAVLGSSVTIRAVAKEGYHFTQWFDGSTENPRNIKVSGNSTYMAFFASNQVNDNLTWTLENGILTIYGSGNMADYSSSNPAPWYPWASSITKVVFSKNLTTIGNYAFSGCSSLTSVTIPNSVTTIGNYAFYNCSGLTSITIPNSVTSIGEDVFYGCSSLTSINIPNSVTSIGEDAFYGCSSLTEPIYNDHIFMYMPESYTGSYTIPNGIKSIAGKAFYHCSKLTAITIPNSVTSIGEDAFYGCSSLTSVTIPNSVTSIGNYAFYGCSSLTSVTIPNSVTTIGNYAFYNCSSLTSIEIPNSVTSIGECAFSGCSGLTSVTIPNGVTSIGNQAFYNCSSLTSVTIPNSIKSIGEAAFYGCSGLTAVHISDLAAWCKISFGLSSNPLYCAHNLYLNGKLVKDLEIPNSVTSIGAYTFLNCSSLTSVTIPNSVTSIGKNAFYGCRDLTSLLIGENVLSIGEGAFDGCSRLKSVIIPNSVTSIGRDAFYGCSELTSVTIPSSVTSIGKNAFQDCSLQSVIMEPVTPPSLGLDGVFDFVSGYAVYVPLGALTTYQENSQWKYYNLRVFDTSYKTSTVSPTSATITFSASINEENKNNYIGACGIEEGEEFSGNIAEYIGLEPESEYNGIPFYIRTTKGDVQTITVSFTTSALTLKTQQSQPVSANTAILLAETNMSDAETSCGFEWKRNDAPADMPATQVLCPVATGLMAGRLKGLKDDVYYKYRAFYKSAAGNYYYGDWQYIFTGDVTVEFDPILYTYAAQFVTERTATVKGYALAGSEDFTEQGFEYWADSRTANAPVRRAPHYEIGEKHTVKGTGISMRVTLSDLDEGTVYKYRTYAKVGSKTLYGTEMTFTTQGTYEEPVVTDLESIDDGDNADGDGRAPSSDAPQARKYIRNGILLIERNGKTYNVQGQ